MANILEQSIEGLLVLETKLKEVMAGLKSNQKIISTFDTETTGLSFNKREMKQNNAESIDKIIEVGAVFSIKETDENGNEVIVPLLDENGADLGFRYFFNPWLDKVKNFPEEMPTIPFEVHGTSRLFLEGKDTITISDEKLAAPAPSISHQEEIGDGIKVSYIEKMIDLFNTADELVAHNASFDMGMLNEAIHDYNEILKKEHLKTLEDRLAPWDKDLAKKEERAENLKTPEKKTIALEEIDLIKREIELLKQVPAIGYYKGKVIDTVVVFKNVLPAKKQLAMQSEFLKGDEVVRNYPINHKLDTLMRIGGQAERTVHGAYWDSKLLIDSYAVLLKDYINRDEEVKKIEEKMDYISNFDLTYEDGQEVLSSDQEEAKLLSEAFSGEFNLLSEDFITKHIENQLENINKRVRSDVNKATSKKVASSYELLLTLIKKNFPSKVSTLAGLSKVIESAKLPKLKKDEDKDTSANLNIVKAIWGLIEYELEKKYSDNLIYREKDLNTKTSSVSSEISISNAQTYKYFRTDGTVPTKDAEKMIMVGSVNNFKKLFRDTISGGSNELTLMDVNVISNMYYVKKALKSFNEENPDTPIILKYGLSTTLQLENGDRVELNLSAQNDEGVKNLTTILSKIYQNDNVEPFLTLEDISSGLLKNTTVTYGSYKGVIENILFDETISSPKEKKKLIFANLENILKYQDEINLEFYESDGFLNEYKTNLVEALRKKYPNKTINKVFTDPILYNKGERDMHLMRSLGLGEEIYDRQSIGIIEDTKINNQENDEYVNINKEVGGETPKEEVIIPDFIGDLDFIKEKYPAVYSKLELGTYENSEEKYDLTDTSKENLKRIQTDYYLKLVNEGYDKTIAKLHLTDEEKVIYRARLDYENKIIVDMGFDGYTLLVADFIKILTDDIGGLSGPGRGSAAGSFVSYCLGITAVDPIKNGLLFERYLNPERISLPDIDMDMHGDVRKEKIMNSTVLPQDFKDYVAKKYEKVEICAARELLIDFIKIQRGQDTVVNIVTRGTMKPKSAIDLVCKQLGDDFAFKSGYKFGAGQTPYVEFAKIIKGNWFDKPGISFDDVMNDRDSTTFMNMYNSSAAIKQVVDIAYKIENTISHYGVHAAGVVFLNKKDGWLGNAVMNIGGTNVTAIDGKFIEDTTAIKFDFLGLASLTVIENSLKIIGATVGAEEEARLRLLFEDEVRLYDDAAIYQLSTDENTDGIFQFASDGMQQLNLAVGSANFDDWAATTALYRPGPMDSGMTDAYVAQKQGTQMIEYVFPEMEEILKDTYGTMVYQEQVMQIVQKIGGFTLGGADIVRRGMGKKDEKLLQSLKQGFVEGAVKIYVDQPEKEVSRKASDLFDLILKFAGYGFNKSHSVAYTNVSVRMGYLKAHYPQQFFTASLLNRQDEIEKLGEVIVDLRKNNLNLVGSDINKSMVNFEIRDGKIIYGLDVIKGTNTSDMKSLISDRDNNGDFKSFNDFLNRAKYGENAINVSKTSMEGLIIAGALDGLPIDDVNTPSGTLENISEINKFNSKNNEEVKSVKRALMLRTFRLLEISSPKAKDLKEIDEEYENNRSILFMSRLENEKTGSYSAIDNPLENNSIKEQILKNKGTVVAFDLMENPLLENGDFVFNAVVKKVKTGENKKGDDFVSFEIVDVNGISKIVSLSSGQVKEYKDNVQDGSMVKLNINVSVKEEENGTKRAYFKMNEMSVYEDKNGFKEVPVIEKDKYSIKDIDVNVLNKDLLVESPKVEKEFNESQYGFSNQEDKKDFVLFLKGYRGILTKKGKPMYFLELSDGINKKTLTVTHFGDVDEADLDKNMSLPIRLSIGKKKGTFGMSTAFNSKITIIGEDGLLQSAIDRENTVNHAVEMVSNEESKAVVQEDIQTIDYTVDNSKYYKVVENEKGYIIEVNTKEFEDELVIKGDGKYFLGNKLYAHRKIYVNDESKMETILEDIQEAINKKTQATKGKSENVVIVEGKEAAVVEKKQVTVFVIANDKGESLTYQWTEDNKYKLVSGAGANTLLLISKDTMFIADGEDLTEIVIVGVPSVDKYDINVKKELVSFSTAKYLSGFSIETNNGGELVFNKNAEVYITEDKKISIVLDSEQVGDILDDIKEIKNVQVRMSATPEKITARDIKIVKVFPQYDDKVKKTATINDNTNSNGNHPL